MNAIEAFKLCGGIVRAAQLPGLVTIAPIDKWVAECLAALAAEPLRRLESRLGVVDLESKFKQHVAAPAGAYVERAVLSRFVNGGGRRV